MTDQLPPRFILFLPPCPSPPTLASLKAAFGSTLVEVLKEVAKQSEDTPKAAILEIALAVPILVGSQHTARSTLFHSVQKVVAGIYKLICVIAARDEINVEDDDGVDARVLLVAWSPDGSAERQQRLEPYGPIIDLEGLAHSGRQWQYAFGVESEAGEAMVRAFVAAKGSGGNVGWVEGGPIMKSATDTSTQSDGTAPSQQLGKRKHYHIATGGTFDHIHIGHKLLLTMFVFAFDDPFPDSIPERTATVGITGDPLLTKKQHAEVLESWSRRAEATKDFIDSIINFTTTPPALSHRNAPGPNGKALDVTYPTHPSLHSTWTIKLTELQDPSGPPITEEKISAIVLSAETRAGGQAINEKRAERGWEGLEMFEVVVLDAEEDEEVKEGFEGKVSSTAIRERLVRKMGRGGTSSL
ncbi:pantetheine-phosphate adenylyltransferase family protein [Teratosphaeria destructans]|uniref:Pantetheine-phosphate adenylyltransferase family protein n=1 Tax=Teratosphaeria destructans TaxID=418781 RepID=A0A9W7W5T2_9PEZI|nr:pantetheine-phosphate adenylyltransferase family protein [Teratosphaeria destructans]